MHSSTAIYQGVYLDPKTHKLHRLFNPIELRRGTFGQFRNIKPAPGQLTSKADKEKYNLFTWEKAQARLEKFYKTPAKSFADEPQYEDDYEDDFEPISRGQSRASLKTTFVKEIMDADNVDITQSLYDLCLTAALEQAPSELSGRPAQTPPKTPDIPVAIKEE